MIDNLELNYDE